VAKHLHQLTAVQRVSCIYRVAERSSSSMHCIHMLQQKSYYRKHAPYIHLWMHTDTE